MKTRIFSLMITLALLLLVIVGCGNSVPDYSRFTMPEDSGKLVIYSPGNMYSSVLDPAIEIYKQLYPEIEVSYQVVIDDEYENRVRMEIFAGKGPDLILMTDCTFTDIYQIMSNGVFEDLNPYFATDGEIELSDFVEPVMDGGLLKGRRYVAPLSYEMPLILTTKSILEEISMTADELKTCDGFCEGAERFKEKYPDSTLFLDLGGVNPASGDILTLYQIFGFNLINYETNEVDIDEARFRQYIDLVKLYFDPDYDASDESMWDLPYYTAGGGLHLRCFPYDDQCADGYINYANSRLILTVNEEEPVLFLPSNQRDGVTARMAFGAAIPKGAENKASAWKLLKILLSDEIQGGHDEARGNNSYFWTGFPVRLSSTKSVLYHDSALTPTGAQFDGYIKLVQSPTEAVMCPWIYTMYIQEYMLPYIRGEDGWKTCYKNFVKALKNHNGALVP